FATRNAAQPPRTASGVRCAALICTGGCPFCNSIGFPTNAEVGTCIDPRLYLDRESGRRLVTGAKGQLLSHLPDTDTDRLQQSDEVGNPWVARLETHVVASVRWVALIRGYESLAIHQPCDACQFLAAGPTEHVAGNNRLPARILHESRADVRIAASKR